jgi:hypothetical protein
MAERREATLASEGIEGRATTSEIVVSAACSYASRVRPSSRRAIIASSTSPRRMGATDEKDRHGFQGELYTQILGGLENGDQVVTFGSFFIDSEHKLKHANPELGQ